MTQDEAKNYVAVQLYSNNQNEIEAKNVRNSVNKSIDYTKEIEDKVATIGLKVGKLPSLMDADNAKDLDIVDENGNVIGRFENGHFKTKEFDSTKVAKSSVTPIIKSADGYDWVVTDSEGYILVGCKDGQIKTKNFDSSATQHMSIYKSEGETILKIV